MTLGSAIYRLIIGPLELFFEALFCIVNRLTNNPGISIVFLSLAINFLVLPLYQRADAMQAEERDIETRLQPWVKHIRKTFSGDERFMMLQTFYRQNNYKPTYALRGSLSLLLQIPFFIAAYNFLSHLSLLQGFSFGPIQDLGLPDGLVTLGSLQINLLPILMTVVNLISAAIYLKGFPIKTKLQMIAMAVLFLILLYSSPAGLVFYWLLNNVFSLLKNIFYKMKHPQFVLSALFSTAGIMAVVFILLHPQDTPRKTAFYLLASLLLQGPILFYLTKRKFTFRFKPLSLPDHRLYWYCIIAITVFTGALIPSAVIKSSPLEFIEAVYFRSPLWYVLATLLYSSGCFLIWFTVFFYLSSSKGKQALCFSAFVLIAVAAINYLSFDPSPTTLNSILVYDLFPVYFTRTIIYNILILVLVFFFLLVLFRKFYRFSKVLSLAVCITTIAFSLYNISSINQYVKSSKEAVITSVSKEPELVLSKEENNVVVLMMDRAISSFIPFLFSEKPELLDQFSGFTYYPNTVSFGPHTNVGSPGLYGGYEYTPLEMNKRDQELLVDKHNEALKVMPVLFEQNGFDVTVCDPSYANYKWIPDLSIYDEYPDIKSFITEGRYGDIIPAWNTLNELRFRNFFCYSIYRCAPLFVQPTLYQNGGYNRLSSISNKDDIVIGHVVTSVSTSIGINMPFLEKYTALQHLPSITTVAEQSEGGSFIMLANETAHEPMLLQEPDFVPSNAVDNTKYDQEHYYRTSIDGRSVHFEDVNTTRHYQTNMAAMMLLGQWFDDLREKGVYDNTRIIIVSDHGRDLNDFLNAAYDADLPYPAPFLNALLMVKDFNSTGFDVDWSYMTNADVPTLASADIITDPVNPFTGSPINSLPKDTSEGHLLFMTIEWDTEVNNGTTFLPGEWYSISNNIFDPGGWAYVGQD